LRTIRQYGLLLIGVDMSALTRFLRDESGATAIEYALLSAILGVALIAAISKLGTNLSNKFAGMASNVT
jgi:pilus assembly protein Flp/PilA